MVNVGIKEDLVEGLRQSAEGEVVDLGSFEQYVDAVEEEE